MRKFLFALALATVLMISATEAKTSIGLGASECKYFNDADASSRWQSLHGYYMWVFGYLSGANNRSDKDDFLDLLHMDMSVMEWLTQYCQTNPSATLQTAADKLLVLLEQKLFPPKR